MSEQQKPVGKAVGVSLRTSVNGTELVLQTHYDAELSTQDQDKFLDLLVDRVERQKAKFNIPSLEHDITRAKAALDQTKTALDQLDGEIAKDHAKSGRTGETRISEPNKQRRGQLQEQMKKQLEGILYEQSRLDALKAKFGIYEDKKEIKAKGAAKAA